MKSDLICIVDQLVNGTIDIAHIKHIYHKLKVLG